MKLTFLEADQPLTKTYVENDDGTYTATSYPNVYKVTSYEHDVACIEQFADALKEHAKRGNCLHTNSLARPLVKESRKGVQVKDELRRWIVLDVDGLEKGISTVEQFIKQVLPSPFHNVSYIIQHSPSSGIKTGLRAHVFFVLDSEVDTKTVSQWLKWVNLDSKILSDQVTLSKNARALSYPLDWVANNNGRVVYITSPECANFDDPVKNRIKLVKKGQDVLTFSWYSVPVSQLRDAFEKKINELREKAGYKKDRSNAVIYRYEGEQTYVEDKYVEPGRVTEWIEDNDDYMRCNIDGGDSFAYYYNRKNPEYLYNFKGEPAVKLSVFDPDFYEATAKPYAEAAVLAGRRAFIFRNHMDDKYYGGVLDGNEVIKQPAPITAQKIDDFFDQYGGTPPATAMTYDIVFRPNVDKQLIEDESQYNLWVPSQYLKEAEGEGAFPPIIKRIIEHVAANDDETVKHFLNWLAFIVKNRAKTTTAWIFHGVPGTGKGLLVNKIIAPIIGHFHTAQMQVSNLKDMFNGWMESALIVNIDEANTDEAGFEQKAVLEKLKLWITEPRVSIRHMNQTARPVENYSNFIFTSNDFGMIPIQDGDRRFNVAPRQSERLQITLDEVGSIENELQAFTNYLMNWEVDTKAVFTVLEGKSKEMVREAASTTMQSFVKYAMAGNYDWFEEGRRHQAGDMRQQTEFNKWLDRCEESIREGAPMLVHSTDLCNAYNVLVAPKSDLKPKRFASLMAKQGYPSTQIMVDGVRGSGWRIEWEASHELLVLLKSHIRDATKTTDEIEEAIREEVASD